MTTECHRIDDNWRIPDSLWERLDPLLPRHKRRRTHAGRKPLEWRQVIDGIFYVLRTGCQWKAAPREFGSGSSLHRYFQFLVATEISQQSGRWPCRNTTTSKASNGNGKASTEP